MCRTTISVISAIALLIFLPYVTQAQNTITTVAGGVPRNVPAIQAFIGQPSGVFKDSAGNLYIASGYLGQAIYKVDLSGQLTTVAGNGTQGFSGEGGPATDAAFSNPTSVFVDGSGNIFIADSYNDRIREVVAAKGIIQTVAGNGQFGYSGDGGPATNAQLDHPSGVFVDGYGNIFIADSYNNRIREVVAATGIIQTVAGNGYGYGGDGGPATSAKLRSPSSVFVDGSGNIFIADISNNRVREVDATTGIIQTVAGNGTAGFSGDGGPATRAGLYGPHSVFVDGSGNIFIADTYNNRVREVDATTGIIQTVAGDGTAALYYPSSVFVDGSGNIFIADTNTYRVREVIAATGDIQTVAGSGATLGDGGSATSAALNSPFDASVDSSGNLFIADTNNYRVREVVAATGNIQTVAGRGSGSCDLGPCPPLGDGGPATSAVLTPFGVYVDGAGNIFITDGGNSANFVGIREVIAATGIIHTVTRIGGSLSRLGGLSVDGAGNMFVTDFSMFSRVWEVVAAGTVQTAAGGGHGGDGGPATGAALTFPRGVFVDSSGNIFIADTGNNRVREVDATTGIIQTVAGNGTAGFSGDGGPATSAQLAGPYGVYVDSLGHLFIADTGNNRVREVDAVTGNIQTVAGNGSFGFAGDGGPPTSAELQGVFALRGDRQGNLLIADGGNNRVRRVSGLVAVVGITVTTAKAKVRINTTRQFTATVTGATNTAVTWSISGAGCNPNTACGMIDSSGLYTAPAVVPSPPTFAITATPVADPSKTASATVTVRHGGGDQEGDLEEP
jgi:trimeric autotransporter adhesin